MIAPTFAAPAVAFADATGGQLRWGRTGEEVAYPDGSYVYVNLRGVVRLERHGQPVVDLGAWDQVDELVAAYRAAVSA